MKLVRNSKFGYAWPEPSRGGIVKTPDGWLLFCPVLSCDWYNDSPNHRLVSTFTGATCALDVHGVMSHGEGIQ